MTTPEQLKKFVRNVPGYPQPGVIFRDITPLLARKELFREVVALMSKSWSDRPPDLVAAIGATVAVEACVGGVPVDRSIVAVGTDTGGTGLIGQADVQRVVATAARTRVTRSGVTVGRGTVVARVVSDAVDHAIGNGHVAEGEGDIGEHSVQAPDGLVRHGIRGGVIPGSGIGTGAVDGVSGRPRPS